MGQRGGAGVGSGPDNNESHCSASITSMGDTLHAITGGVEATGSDDEWWSGWARGRGKRPEVGGVRKQ